MSDEPERKPWAQLNKEERAERMKEGRERATTRPVQREAAPREPATGTPPLKPMPVEPSIADVVIAAALDSGVLTDEERAKIREQARLDARAKIAKELRAAEMKQIMAEVEAEERLAAGLGPEIEHTLLKGAWPKYGPPPQKDSDRKEITIGLPPFADAIRIDQKVFVNGYTYRVSPEQYLAIVDQQEWSWRHEDELRGKWRDHHPRQRDTHMNVNRAGNYH